jgi:hypothetical protein
MYRELSRLVRERLGVRTSEYTVLLCSDSIVTNPARHLLLNVDQKSVVLLGGRSTLLDPVYTSRNESLKHI